MLKKSILLILILISCGNNNLNKSKENDLRKKKYKNTEIYILKGKIYEVKNLLLLNKIISKDEAKDFIEEYEENLDLARNYFLRLRQKSNKISLESLKNYLKLSFKKIKIGMDNNGFGLDELFVSSFGIDSYLISKELGFNINFEEYVRAFIEEIRDFLDENLTKKVYFSVYDTKEKYEKTFIKVLEEVFSK